MEPLEAMSLVDEYCKRWTEVVDRESIHMRALMFTLGVRGQTLRDEDDCDGYDPALKKMLYLVMLTEIPMYVTSMIHDLTHGTHSDAELKGLKKLPLLVSAYNDVYPSPHRDRLLEAFRKRFDDPTEDDRVLLVEPAVEPCSAYDNMFSKEDWDRIANEPLTPGF